MPDATSEPDKKPTMTTEIKLGSQLKIAENVLRSQVAGLESGEVRTLLEKAHGRDNVWNDEQFANTFAVSYFDPPIVHVIRRSDRKRGIVYFTHKPRFYFSFNAESSTTNG